MEKVRFGVVGVGNIGTAHVNCLAENRIEGAVLSAVCDIRSERRAFCEEKWGIPAFERYEDMFKSNLLDAVIISVPHPLHADMAISALKEGLHVVLEKPADISVSKVRTLNDIAKTSGKVFSMMFNQRTSPLFARARELVKGGALGELKRTSWVVTNWYRTQHYYDSGDWRATWAGEGGGVLLNQAPHNLDIWQWICGMPATVTAFCDEAKYHRIEVEDAVTIFTRYPSGATGTFVTSTGEYPGTNRLEIVGDKGKLVLEDGKLKWWRLAESEREFCFASDGNLPCVAMEYSEFTPETREEAHAGILRNVTDAILHGVPLLAPGTDGIYELSISNAAYLSAWTGNREIVLPFDAAKFDRLLAEKTATSSYRPVLRDTDHSGEYSPRWRVNW